ncbi:hypothetical protein GEMRC1_003763 [Eukaryota sp. GEM-RC1]
MTTTNYALSSYWDLRYSEVETASEWLCDFSNLHSYIMAHLFPQSEILVLGCGNSRMPVDLYDFGYPYVSAIDFSEVVIDQMQEQWADRDTMDFLNMDARSLDFPSSIFDVVIDKALLDTVLCGSDAYLNVRRVLREVYRVLKDGGVYIVVSHGHPEHRLNLFSSDKWRISHKEIVSEEQSDQSIFIYFLQKKL